MLDSILYAHLFISAGRIAFALLLFGFLFLVGRATLSLFRWHIDDPMERTLLEIATGLAIYQAVVRWLGELNVLRPLGIVALLGVLAILAFAVLRMSGTSIVGPIPIPFPGAPRVAGLLLLILLLLPLPMALAPAVSQDALIYHLRFPEMTLWQGRWAHDPANSGSYNPAATSTLYLATLAIDRTGSTAQIIHFGFFVLAVVAAGAFARRCGAASGIHAAILLAALPAAAIIAGWAWADDTLLFVLAAAVLALFAGVIPLAMLLIGLAAAVKYSAIVSVVIFGATALLIAARRHAWIPFAVGVVLAVLVNPWYLINWIRIGNPIYPLGGRFFGGDPLFSEMATQWSGQSPLRVWSNYILRPDGLDNDIGGFLFAIVALVGLFLVFRQPASSALRIAALLSVVLWVGFLPFTTSMRLLLPAPAASLLVAGAALEQFGGALKRATVMLIAIFAIRGAMVTAAHNQFFFNPLPAAVGIEEPNAYRYRIHPWLALFDRAADQLPPDARVLAVHEVRLFGFPRPTTASRVYDRSVLLPYVRGAGNAAEAIGRLRQDGVTHLLIAPRPAERGTPRPDLTPREKGIVNEIVRSSRRVDQEDSLILLELPK